jgi:hypothetical protein
MLNPFQIPTLTRTRIVLAFGVALAADAIQILLGPLGWTFFDEVIDVFAMIVICLLLGFHPLLLPTFLVEFIPVIDMLPTWTGCVGAVVLLRRKQQQSVKPPPVPPKPQDRSKIIDV